MTKGNKSLDEQGGDVGTQEAMEEEDTSWVMNQKFTVTRCLIYSTFVSPLHIFCLKNNMSNEAQTYLFGLFIS